MFKVMGGSSVPQINTVMHTFLHYTVVVLLMDSVTQFCQIMYLGDKKTKSLTVGVPALSVFWAVLSVCTLVTGLWRALADDMLLGILT